MAHIMAKKETVEETPNFVFKWMLEKRLLLAHAFVSSKGGSYVSSRAQLSPMTSLRRGNPEGFQRLFAPLALLCLPAPLDEVIKAFELTADAIMLQGVFSPCESDTPRAPGRTDCP
ncbi:hypothetical protein EVAR_70028_1 [Eumeta japonica]|uniref:Uncharacterized protein n=1 Tax=Eumeta variegata TaxID=151549 RepID=A0A4C2A477_EUMVA|nr:hypothetical protein EVAR_70028_1 [Eumeta japonica]